MEGKQEIKSGFEEIGNAGDAAAKRASGAWQKTGDDIDAVTKKQVDATRKVDAFMSTPIQSRIDSSVGTGYDRSANARASEYARLLAEQERQANALLNAINPLRAAQAAYDHELEVANGLLARGVISEGEHKRAVDLSTRALEQARAEQGRGAANDNARKFAIQNLGFQFQDFAVQVVGGTGVLRAFAQQAPQAAGALGGMGGALGKVGAFLNGPFGIALTLATVLASGFADKLFDTGSAADKLAERQEHLATIIDRTTGRIKEQNVALIQNTALGTQGDKKDALSDLQVAKRRADSLFSVFPQTMEAYSQVLKGVPGSLGELTNTISSLSKFGDTGKQYIKPMSDALAELVTKGRGIQSLNAQLRLLQGNGRPDDRLKAFGDFGRDKPDISLTEAKAKLAAATDTQQRAQARLNLVQVEGRKAVEDGTKSEAAYQKELTAAQSAVYAADAAHKALAASQRVATKEAKDLAKELAKLNIEPTLGPMIEAFSNKFGEAGKVSYKEFLKGLDDAQQERLQPTKFAVEQIAAQRDTLSLSQLELATIGMSADKRQVILDQFAKQIELQNQGRGITDDEAKAILDGVAAQDAMNVALERSRDAIDEVRSFTSSMVDDLSRGKINAQSLLQEFLKLAAINPLKNLLGGSHSTTLTDVFGSIGKIFGGAAGLNTGISSADLSATIAATAPKFASGTDYAPGGLAWVAENGPELIRLPRGSSVTPAAQTRRMLAANDGSGLRVQVIKGDMFDVIVQQTAAGVAAPMADAAAARGTAGGASMAQAESRATATRRLGRSW
jgi:alkylhydroperoxidase/carboxymuconolactone decarboxylase family protein YurZ